MVDDSAQADTMDPSVSVIESILTAAAAASLGPVPVTSGKVRADRALWWCACATDIGFDAPTWLIYDTFEGRLGWCRVPDHQDISDLVEAPLVVGDHVHPLTVLSWLQDSNPRYWPGYSEADQTIVADVGRTIRDLAGD